MGCGTRSSTFTTADDQVDCFFMDDGARSARYTPLYTNSGFYFIRNNMRTQFFMHRMLMAYDTVLAVRPHQHALIMLLLEHMARHGRRSRCSNLCYFRRGRSSTERRRSCSPLLMVRSGPTSSTCAGRPGGLTSSGISRI